MVWKHDFSAGLGEEDFKKFEFVRDRLRLFITEKLASETGSYRRWRDENDKEHTLSMVKYDGTDWLVEETTDFGRTSSYRVDIWHSSGTGEMDLRLTQKLAATLQESVEAYDSRSKLVAEATV